ncbi:hypothetical protein AVEN_132596-1 [Araneus ventricosus]|uniref:RNA-directed DNA polymerase n=1 Tax=Araneus ventricosus TaxID=182803 RepID=A0A4Y2AWW6_ARAVE|nr:hypothetical protein AVEN_132596-1 [Araneus ventricosus]
MLNLDLGLRRDFQFPFIIADVTKGYDEHDVKHFIETNGQPIHAKARQLDPKRLSIAKEEFTFMLNNEIIRPSNSQWSSPLHLATKKDGSYRPCGDYCQFNAQTIPDRYPIPRITEVSSIDYDQIADAQTQDEELKSLQTITSLNLKEYPLPSGKYLWCDTSTSKIRPYIPQAFRKQIFHHIHGLSHPGIKSAIKLTNSKFIWPSIKKDVQLWTRTCIPCQKAKIYRHTKTKLGEYEVPLGRFCVAHIDLIGPLPPSRGSIYCLTCIDRSSSWMEAIPLDNISADTVARAFYSNWIARFGMPHKLITDRGIHFRSETL